ncbi:hypothetical protein HOY82DRAFT_669536 [Tuber indicum]|nr:hypothetical protein HOY82DRAFT_669536 [Tuber indicum]
MKWTADNDQLLFLKLIETHDVSVRPQKIQEAWPRDGREVPTARAISERIAKIRNAVKTASTGTTSFSPTSSAQTTPRKRKNVQGNGGKSSSGNSGHLQGDASKGQEGPVRKRRGRPRTSAALVKEGLEDGSFTPFPPGFGIFGAERLGDDEPSRRIKAEKRNSEGSEDGQVEETD